MIISCEKCNKKFEVKDDLIPIEGRLLQCGICRYQWHFTPSNPLKLQEEVITKKIKSDNKDRLSNILFVIGLIFGPLFYLIIYENNINFQMTSSISLIFIGGLLVGIGTKIGTGCTSGHGICGISRFSIRSLLATIIFVIFGMLTVFILGFFGVY